MRRYPDVSGSPAFPDIEKGILCYWDSRRIFEKSVKNRPADKCYVFYDGPPFANGLPHYGHLLTGFIKDVVARYKTMRGYKVERRFGWDCHGLPVEMLSEKELKVSGRTNIENFGIEKFNDHCRSSIMRFTKQWQDYVTRQARWVDFKNGYKTMDKDFMESVIWAFHELWKKGLVYESLRVVPYSWACQTPLSNFETKIDNAYREKVSKTVTVKFELQEKPAFARSDIKSYKLLAWTTTPWTLVANLALAINTSITYIAAVIDKEMLIFSEGYQEQFKLFCKKNNLDNVEFAKIDGKQLVSTRYKPLFPYLADCENAFQVLDAEFVTEDAGTGIVHIAPGFGEDDFILCKRYNIPNVTGGASRLLSVICPIDDAGNYTSVITHFAGLNVFEANDPVIKYLKERGSWFETGQYIHNYPHCWRTDTPLIYRAMSSWYVEVTKLIRRMTELNDNVNWIPDHVKDGQFGKWLAGAKDWSISRNRFWGAPVPVWKSDNPEYPRIDVYGSIKKFSPDVRALEEDFGPIEDLHRPYIDQLVRPNPDDPTGKSMMRRVPDVLDCWFESGSMPYAQVHYPFENKEKFEANFPADFITEYIAQTRGWFYTLFVLSTGIFDKNPFQNCICHGVVLDIEGQKLSKRLNNYPDPMEMFERYGADAVRFLMLSSSVSTGGDMLLDKSGEMIRDTLRGVIKPIWNSYCFFTVYANADGVRGKLLDTIDHLGNIMDRYILFECMELVKKVKGSMEAQNRNEKEGLTHDPYDIKLACAELVQFADKLNNWYIRRSRERFWSSEKSEDKTSAYDTLYTVLYYFVRVAAPFLPFISEAIWLGLDFGLEESVHLTDFPDYNALGEISSKHLENTKNMQLAMDVCSHVLSLRNAHCLRVRQPLKSLRIYPYMCPELANLPPEYRKVILEEVNIKELTVSEDAATVANFDLKLNFSMLGKRIPDKVKSIIPLMKQGSWQVLNNGDLLLGNTQDEGCIVHKDEFSMNLRVTDKCSCPIISHGATVGVVTIDPEITHELLLEGIARDIVRLIQQARKDHGLSMLSMAEAVIVTHNSDTDNALEAWMDFITKQTLLSSLTRASAENLNAYSSGYTRISAKEFDVFVRGTP